MQYIIRIEEPCNEGWDNMTPESNGRHCKSCCKTVIDFTDWEPADIVQYVIARGKGTVCGHIRAEHLNVPIETPETLAEKAWNASIPLYRKVAAVIILLFGITITSCNTNPEKPIHTVAKTEQKDTSIKSADVERMLSHFKNDTSKYRFDGGISIHAPGEAYPPETDSTEN